MSRNKNIKKGIVIGTFLLFLIASVHPIVGKTNNENETYLLINNTLGKKGSLTDYDIAYIQGGFLLECWLYEIALNDPDDPSCICPDYPSSGSGGTCTKEGTIITSEYGTGQIYEVDPLTCEWNIIGGGGVSLNSLAYDPTRDEIYACTICELFKIDRESGSQEYVGGFGVDVINMVGIACDADGDLYGWDLGDNLWTINKKTGDATLVGALGIDLSYASDGDFHKTDDILYITTYTSNLESYLYECDEDSGNCTLVGQFKDNVEVTLFAIPWNYDPTADFNWEPEVPDPGETITFDATDSTDPDDNIILYEWDWDNDGVYDESYDIPTATHIFDEVELYNVTLRVEDSYTAEDILTKTVRVGNHPPEKPDINGSTTAKPWNYYKYCVSPVDPDGDTVFYVRWDWDDGNVTGWLGPSSEEEICAYHLWKIRKTYTVKAQIKDEFGAESEWGELKVKVPRDKMHQNLFLLRLLERFPLIKQILGFFGEYN